jgi:uncharacterized protein YkwD
MELIIIGGLAFIFFIFASKMRGMGLGAKIDDFRERKRTAQLKILNHYRLENGLKALKPDSSLHRLAKAHSIEMAESGVCGHRGEEGRMERVQKLRRSRFFGENCFKYPKKEYAGRIDGRLGQRWLDSPRNSENVLDPRYTVIGIGVVSHDGHVYTTHLFSG